MKKYPVSYAKWQRAISTDRILPPHLAKRFILWRDIHPDSRTCLENYRAYVSFLALHLSKLEKLLQGIDDV